MKEDITPNFPPDQPVKLINWHELPVDISPRYTRALKEASHIIHCALDEMLHTPCVTKEQFESIVKIYCDLNDYIDSVTEILEKMPAMKGERE